MRTVLRTLLIAVSAFAYSSCSNYNIETEKYILPTPVDMQKLNGTFTFQDNMGIYLNDNSLLPINALLQESLGMNFNYVTDENNASLKIILSDDIKNAGGYKLSVHNNQLVVYAADYNGAVSAISTVRQLVPISEFSKQNVQKTIPNIEISDYSEYQWRGMHLDVSRHFYTKDEVKKLLDLMSLYKFNKFHWHLTDDQGWRIEIKKYPLLTEKGAWRKFNEQDRTCMALEKANSNPDYKLPSDRISVIEGDTIYGGYYTQEDIKEIVKYASDRGIDVIPEIDMPGHFLAAINQYPEIACKGLIGWGQVFSSPICPGKELTMEFCKNIWREVFQLFPYEYAHLGGDEVEKINWKKCKDCQKRMRQEKLKSPEELQAWFVREMEEFFHQNGKNMMGWDEVVEDGLSEKAVISWWRSWCPDAVAKATEHGMKAVICPNSHLYFDYEQKADYLKKIYDMNVVPAGLNDEQKKLVWGVQCNIWTEWIPSQDRLEYMVFPRMMAVSEIGWCNKSRLNDFDTFENKVMNHIKRLDAIEVNYRIPDLTGFYDKNVFVDKSKLEIKCALKDVAVHYTTDGSEPTLNSPLYSSPIEVTEDTKFKFRAFRPNGTSGRIYETEYVKEEMTPACETVKDVEDGLMTSLYDFDGSKCADINKDKLIKTYVTDRLKYPAEKTGNLAVVFSGYINIPSDGIYTFNLLSDDGSIMKINDEVVIENDGLHSPADKTAQKALSKGLHKLEVSYFDYYGGVIRLSLIDDNGEMVECSGDWFKHENILN